MNAVELESLNNLLKGELSAVESYGVALEKVEKAKVAKLLRQCRDSHAERVQKLTNAIIGCGGTPVESTGVWGSFSKMVTSTAATLGDSAIVAALEEGEDVGSNEYEWKILSIHGENRKLVRDELWPKQQATHKLVSQLANQSAGGVWPPAPETKDA